MRLVIVAWLVAGFLSWGAEFAHLQGKFPRSAENWRQFDLCFSAAMGLAAGPSGLLFVALMDGVPFPHGFRWF